MRSEDFIGPVYIQWLIDQFVCEACFQVFPKVNQHQHPTGNPDNPLKFVCETCFLQWNISKANIKPEDLIMYLTSIKVEGEVSEHLVNSNAGQIVINRVGQLVHVQGAGLDLVFTVSDVGTGSLPAQYIPAQLLALLEVHFSPSWLGRKAVQKCRCLCSDAIDCVLIRLGQGDDYGGEWAEDDPCWCPCHTPEEPVGDG